MRPTSTRSCAPCSCNVARRARPRTRRRSSAECIACRGGRYRHRPLPLQPSLTLEHRACRKKGSAAGCEPAWLNGGLRHGEARGAEAGAAFRPGQQGQEGQRGIPVRRPRRDVPDLWRDKLRGVRQRADERRARRARRRPPAPPRRRRVRPVCARIDSAMPSHSISRAACVPAVAPVAGAECAMTGAARIATRSAASVAMSGLGAPSRTATPISIRPSSRTVMPSSKPSATSRATWSALLSIRSTVSPSRRRRAAVPALALLKVMARPVSAVKSRPRSRVEAANAPVRAPAAVQASLARGPWRARRGRQAAGGDARAFLDIYPGMGLARHAEVRQRPGAGTAQAVAQPSWGQMPGVASSPRWPSGSRKYRLVPPRGHRMRPSSATPWAASRAAQAGRSAAAIDSA